MPNIIDKQQLQATAQVAKSYILEQDTANVTTIINALQQGGGSAPATAKTVPTLSISAYPDDINLTSQDGVNYSYQYDAAYDDVTFTVEYNGDGTLLAFAIMFNGLDEHQSPIGTAAFRQGHQSGSTYQFSFDAEALSSAESIVVVTTETANFAPKVLILDKEV